MQQAATTTANPVARDAGFIQLIHSVAGKGAFFVGRKIASNVIIPILAITNLTPLYSSKASAPIRIKKLRLQSKVAPQDSVQASPNLNSLCSKAIPHNQRHLHRERADGRCRCSKAMLLRLWISKFSFRCFRKS